MQPALSHAAFSLCYADQSRVARHLTQPDHLLGVVGFGTQRPDNLPQSCPFVAVPLMPLSKSPMFEIWTAASRTRACQQGSVVGSCSADLAFGAVTLNEAETPGLEDAVERAYDDIFRFLGHTGFNQPIRFWNYLTRLTEEEHGMERYRRFNIGRHRAFMAHLRQSVPPAASCLGAVEGNSIIYFLAAQEAATPIENPRQVSAYAYPEIYGPRSPSFSRAALYGKGGALFISGTASIVGHETRHPGDLQGQIHETIENLKILMTSARQDLSGVKSEDLALKIYLRHVDYHPQVEAALNTAFGLRNQRLFLLAEICRTDLLVEIEAFHQAAHDHP